MKNLKRRVSLLLVAALIISSISLGFGQIKASAVNQATGQLGTYRLRVTTSAQDCNGTGTDDNLVVTINYSDSTSWSTTVVGVGSPNYFEAGTTDTITFTSVPAKPISSITYDSQGTDRWKTDSSYMDYSSDSGATWLQIALMGGFDGTGVYSFTYPSTYSLNTSSLNHVLTFDAAGGTGGTQIYSEYGATLPSSNIPAVTRAGYTFTGWSPSVPGIGPSMDVIYTAQWTPNNVSITFDANSGTGGTGPTSMVVGSALTAPAVTRTGYTFIAWSPSVPAKVPNIDRTYTAIWLPDGETNQNVYNITFNPNGGSGTMAAQPITAGQTAALAANAFTKTGCTFSGWATSQANADAGAAEYINNENYTIGISDITLYAVWKANSYTITFDANGGSGGTSASLLYGAALTAPTVMRTGYTFSGWSPTVPATVPAANTTYTAQWTANQYTVTFDVQGGTASPETSTVTYGSTYGAGTGGFPTPTKTGYTFGGWYTGTSGSGTKILSTTAVAITAAQTLYAKWTAITYTVAYNGNGSTGGSTASSTHTYGTAKALTANGYTKTGYAFTGWATSAAGDVVYTDRQSVSNLTATSGATVTLYAKWTNVNVSTITFDANGGSGGKIFTLLIGAALTAPTVTRTGYTFAGWSPTVPATVPAVNTTYTAQWAANTYAVSFDAQGGTVSPASATVTYASTYGNLPVPTKTGCVFDGWYTAAGGTGTKITSATTVTITAAQTLYANWFGPDSYTITFNANGGTGTMAVQSALKGQTVTLALITFTRTGYIFAGWATSASGTQQYGDGASYTIGTSNVTLYAVWTPITYTVAYDGNGAGGSTASTSHTYGVLKALASGNFTKTGYYISVWNTAMDGSGTSYYPSEYVRNLTSTNGATITLYAIWAIYQSTITFDSRGGTPVASITADYNTVVNEPARPTKAGYYFGGWFQSQFFNDPFTWPYTVTSGQQITLYALWVNQQSWINFDANGGTGGTAGYMIPLDPMSAPVVTRTGYTFTGWSPAVPATVPVGSTKYTAQWVANTYTVSYNGNGSTGGSTANSLHTYDISANLTANGFTKTGYRFLGWSTNSGAASASFTDGQSVINLTTNSGSVITLYAVWEINQYTISFNSNGGTSATAITQNYNTSVAKPTDPVKTGYTFAGWYTDAELTSAVEWPYTMGASNVTFYAKWIAPASVHFAVSSASGMTGDIITVSVTVSENSNLGAITLVVPYDPTVLEVVSYSAGSILNGFALDVNNNETALKITLAAARTTKLTAGGSILDIQFRIKGSAPAGTINTGAYISELTDTETPANALPFDITQGSITIVCKLGDINGSGTVTAVDALMVLQAATGRITLTAEQMLAADVNKSGTVTALDALMILQYATGKLTSFN